MRPFSANFVVRLLHLLLLFSALLAARGAMAFGIIDGPPEPDTSPPTLGITSPAEGAVFENGSVTVQGWATDDPGVSALVSGLKSVQIRVDTLYAAGEYQTIMEPGWWIERAWWSTNVALSGGRNLIRVRAFDGGGLSTEVTRTVYLYQQWPLNLSITGSGTVSPIVNGQLLTEGERYELTAISTAGNSFLGWTGDVTSEARTISFVMQTNITLHATFVPSPFGPAAGNYQGVFYGEDDWHTKDAGLFSASVTRDGVFTASIRFSDVCYVTGGTKCSVSGVLSANGNYEGTMTGSGIRLRLHLDPETRVMTGFVQYTIGTTELSGELRAVRAAFNSKTNPTSLAGTYTLLMPGSDPSSSAPAGCGFCSVKVSRSGGITILGNLADGSAFSQKTILSEQGDWPFYASIKGGGLTSGWITFSNDVSGDIAGQVRCIRPSQHKLYLSGYETQMAVIGSAFRFNSGMPVLNLTNGQARFSSGNLWQSFTNRISLDPKGKCVNLSENKLSLTFSSSTGTFKGTVVDPASGRPVSFKGAVLQKFNLGGGYFPGISEAGLVWIEP